MRGATDNVLPGEQPVSPTETTYMVQSPEEENGSLGILDGEITDTELLCLVTDVGKELSVGKRPIGTELMKDLGEGRFGHWDFEKMVEQRDLSLCQDFSLQLA
jgi:hypothetical protein